MITARVDFDTKIYDDIEDYIKTLPRDYQKAFNKNTRKPIENLRKRLKHEPSRKPSPGFIWSYNKAKQNRARGWWFAALAGRIPGVTIQTSGGHYKRSGKLLKSIIVEIDRPERTIVVSYPDVGKWVIGKQQIPSHANTGWKRIDLELDRAEVEMTDIALKTWSEITDRIFDK